MKRTNSAKRAISAEAIARRADRGESVQGFFTNAGRMMPPIQRVNVDFTAPMLNELDEAARALNISRQAVIKTLLRQALDQQYLARAGEKQRRA
jgi:Ribbon-helix-helix protein, copG family